MSAYFSVGNVGIETWVSPCGKAQLAHCTFFYGNMLIRGLEGSSMSRDGQGWGQELGKSTCCIVGEASLHVIRWAMLGWRHG